MTIGERVKFRRKQLQLTQEELAKRLGNSSRASVCTIEKDREDLTTTRIAKLATALETTPAWLMGWVDSPEKKVIDLTGVVDAVTEATTQAMERNEIPSYYENEETAEIAQELYENEDMRLLFDAAKDSKPEDLKMAADLLKRLKSTNPDG